MEGGKVLTLREKKKEISEQEDITVVAGTTYHEL
jgi:hypothetical protein